MTFLGLQARRDDLILLGIGFGHPRLLLVAATATEHSHHIVTTALGQDPTGSGPVIREPAWIGIVLHHILILEIL